MPQLCLLLLLLHVARCPFTLKGSVGRLPNFVSRKQNMPVPHSLSLLLSPSLSLFLARTLSLTISLVRCVCVLKFIGSIFTLDFARKRRHCGTPLPLSLSLSLMRPLDFNCCTRLVPHASCLAEIELTSLFKFHAFLIAHLCAQHARTGERERRRRGRQSKKQQQK